MKKVLSVILAVMMLFGALSISSSAATIGRVDDALTILKENPNLSADRDYVVIVYYCKTGSMKYAEPVYDSSVPNNFTYEEGVTGTYYRLPTNSDELYIGYNYTLPSITPDDGYAFRGWYCPANGESYVAGTSKNLSSDMLYGDNYIILEALYEGAVAEEDTMATIMNILIKVFGAIIGILFYGGDTAAGAALLEQMVGGLL